MREVRVESLDKMEPLGGEARVSANSGDVNIVFPQNAWNDILSKEPSEAELEESNHLKNRLASFAKNHSFGTIFEDAPCGESGLSYDLALRRPELYAVATGHLFVPAAGSETVEELRAALGRDTFVERAYATGTVASIRGRKSAASRFEVAPELWRTRVETAIPENPNNDDKG